MSSLDEQIEALINDPASEEAAAAVRASAQADGALKAYADAFWTRGRVLGERGLADEALASLFESALVFEEELEDIDSAVSIYQEVLDLEPGHRRALFALGLLLHDLGQFDALVELYRSRLETTHDDGERTTLHLYIAEILAEKLGDEEKALDEVIKATRLTPRNLRIITRLERLGEKTGRLEEVAVVLGDLLMNQEEPRVRAGLALRLAELYLGPLDDRNRALTHFRSALADDGGNPEILEEVQDVFGQQKRFDDLAELLESLTRDRRTGPHRVRIERELARIYEIELGDLGRALSTLARLAREYPEERDLLDEVMRLGLLSQELNVVAETFEEVCDSTSNALLRTYLRLKLGHIYGQMLSKPAKAVSVYTAVIAEDPDHREAQRRLKQLLENHPELEAEIEPEEPTQDGSVPPAALTSESGSEDSDELARVPASAVITDVSEEPTEFEGEEFGPESETAFGGTHDAARAIVHLATPEAEDPSGGAFSETIDGTPVPRRKSTVAGTGTAAIRALKATDWGGSLDEEDMVPREQEDVPGEDAEAAAYVEGFDGEPERSEVLVRPVVPRMDTTSEPVPDDMIVDEESDVEIDDADVLAEEVSISSIVEAESPVPPDREEAPSGRSNLHVEESALRGVNTGEIIQVEGRLAGDESEPTEVASDGASNAEASGAPPNAEVAEPDLRAAVDDLEVRAAVDDLEVRAAVDDLEVKAPVDEVKAPVDDLTSDDAQELPPPPLSGEGSSTAIKVQQETEERLVELQQKLQDATRSDDRTGQIKILTNIVRENQSLGAEQQAFFAQLKLVRVEATAEAFEALMRLAKEANVASALVEAFDEVGARLDEEAQMHFGLEIANIEAESLGQVQSAIERLGRLYDSAPHNDAVFSRWTELLEFDAQTAALAEAHLEGARRLLDIDAARGLYQRAAEIFESSGELERAADVLVAYCDRDPADELIHLEAARLLEATQRFDELVVLLEARVYQLEGANRAMLRRRIASTYEQRLGDTGAAERMLRLALSEDERDTESLDQLVRIYERAGRWNDLTESLTEQIPLVKGNRARGAIRRRIAQVAEQRLRRLDMALQHLDEAVRDDPADLDAMADIERLRRAQQDWAGVADVLTLRSRALSAPKERADTLVEIARLRQNALGDVVGAKEAYHDALALMSDHLVALDELAKLSEQSGDLVGAIDALRNLADVTRGEQQAQVLARIGGLLEVHHGRVDEAAIEYERALAADPNCIDALSPLRRFKEEQRDFAVAFELGVREAALVKDSRQKALLWSKAGDLARFQLDDSPRAIDCYEHALAADDDDVASAASLGELYLTHQKPAQAHRLLAKAGHGLEQSDATRALELWILAGEAAEALTRTDDAITAYRAALDLLPTARKPLMRLGELYVTTESWSDVFEVSTDLVLHHEPALAASDRSEVYLRMARAKRGMDDLEGAIRLGRKSFELTPNHSMTLRHLAESLEQDGQAKEAAEFFVRLAKLAEPEAERRRHLVHASRLLAERAHEPGEAALILGDLHAKDPGDVEVTGLLARYREEVGEVQLAAQALAKTAELQEGRARADLLVEAARIVGSASRSRHEALRYALEATDALPTHAGALRLLSVLLEAGGEYRALAELQEEAARAFLEDASSEADAPEGRTAAAGRLLRDAEALYRYRLDMPLDALRVARRERELGTQNGESRAAFTRLLDETAQKTRQLELKHEAVDAWSSLAESEPGRVEALRRLFALKTELGNKRGARVNAEILVALGEASDGERRQFEAEYGDGKNPPPPGVEGGAVELPLHPSERSPLGDVFGQLGYQLLSALTEAIPEPRPKRRDKVKVAELGNHVGGPLLDAVALFGLELPLVYVRDDAASGVQPTWFDGKPGLVVSLALCEQQSEALLRFSMGWSLSFLRPRALGLAVLPIEAIRDGFEGLVRERIAEELLFSDPKTARRRGKALDKALAAPTKSSVVDRLEQWFGAEERSSLHEEREAVLRSADRAGLLACGSPLVAIEALKIAGRKERSRLHPLLDFAASRVFASVVGRAG